MFIRFAAAAAFIACASLFAGSSAAQVKTLKSTAEDARILQGWLSGPDPVYVVTELDRNCSVLARGKRSDGGSAGFRGNDKVLLTSDPVSPVKGSRIDTRNCPPLEMRHRLANKVTVGSATIAFFLEAAERTCVVPVFHVRPFAGCRVIGCDLAAAEGIHTLTITKSRKVAEIARKRIADDTRLNKLTGFAPTDCSK